MAAISRPVPEGLATTKPLTDDTARERTEQGRCGEVDCELYVNTIKQDIFDKHRVNLDIGLIVILLHITLFDEDGFID